MSDRILDTIAYELDGLFDGDHNEYWSVHTSGGVIELQVSGSDIDGNAWPKAQYKITVESV